LRKGKKLRGAKPPTKAGGLALCPFRIKSLDGLESTGEDGYVLMVLTREREGL